VGLDRSALALRPAAGRGLPLRLARWRSAFRTVRTSAAPSAAVGVSPSGRPSFSGQPDVRRPCGSGSPRPARRQHRRCLPL